MTSRVKRGIATALRSLFFHLDVNRGMAFEAASTPAAIRRIVRRGLSINTIIDIGASNGQWSAEVSPFFPTANFLLVEALKVHQPALDRFVREHKRAQYVLKAAAAREGVVSFDASDAFGGQAGTASRDGDIQVSATTIDHEIAARKLPGPFLLKFDVHGFELPILEGARETLRDCALIVMECYNFNIAPTALLFHDMCRHLHDAGFRVADISEPLWRPSDHMLWQMDIFFVPANRQEFSNNGYA